MSSVKTPDIPRISVLSIHIQKNHTTSNIIGDLNIGVTVRKKDIIGYAKLIANIWYASPIEPTT